MYQLTAGVFFLQWTEYVCNVLVHSAILCVSIDLVVRVVPLEGVVWVFLWTGGLKFFS